MNRNDLVKKTKININKLFDYLTSVEYNVFRLKQLARFGLMISFGTAFFTFMNAMLTNQQWRWYWKLLTAYFLPPAGKETILPAGFSLGLPQPIWFISIWFFDLLLCITVLTNWWLVEIIVNHFPAFPFIGFKLHEQPHIYKKRVSIKNWYDGLQTRVQKIEHKKYGRLLPIFLLFFMLIPFQGSGSLTTCFLGTWLGFRRRYIIFIVLFGSFFSILLITLAYNGLLKLF